MDTVRKYTRTFLVNPRLTRGGGNLKIKLNDEKQGRDGNSKKIYSHFSC